MVRLDHVFVHQGPMACCSRSESVSTRRSRPATGYELPVEFAFEQMIDELWIRLCRRFLS